MERFDYKKFHTKGLKNKDKTEQVKLAKLKGDLQSNTEHTYQSHKRKWNDGMKANLDALANENTSLPLFLQQAFAGVGARSLVINSTMSNPRGASSNPSFLIL